jgi:hypothetical protein
VSTGAGVSTATDVNTGAGVNETSEGNPAAEISFDVPTNWVVENEQELNVAGFIVPPDPLFALVASPLQEASSFVLEGSPAPWLFVTVEDVPNVLPPAQAYELVPEYLMGAESGYSGADIKPLVAHHRVHQGGLSGSTAALMIVSSAGSTSFDEVVYENGTRLWLVVAGCSASCYDKNQPTITQIVDSVRVGTAAESGL